MANPTIFNVGNIHKEVLGNIIDTNTIVDIGNSHGSNFDGVYCGIASTKTGKIAFALQDFNFKGGSAGVIHSQQIIETIETAIAEKCPFLILVNTGGVRVQGGCAALINGGSVLVPLTKASGYIPTIAIAKGTSAGLGAYLVSMCDFAIFLDESQVYLTGPKVIEFALGKKINKEDLGGTTLHTKTTGVATHFVKDLEQAQQNVTEILNLLPNCWEKNQTLLPIPTNTSKKMFDFELPDNLKSPYNMMDLLVQLADENSIHEIGATYAKNLVTCFCQIEGRTVAFFANQPKYLCGSIDVKSTKKIARFVQICDAYNIPMVFFVDTPGFLPGQIEEHAGVVNYGSKAVQILISSTVPRITIAIRRMIGGGYGIMNSKAFAADYAMAWRTIDVAVMGKKAAGKFTDDDVQYCHEELEELGIVDEFIEASQSREKIIEALNKIIQNPKKKMINKRCGIQPI